MNTWTYFRRFAQWSHLFDFPSTPGRLALTLPRLRLHSLGIPLALAALLAHAAWASPRSETLEAEIRTRGSRNFEALLREWEESYGSQAVPPLLKIAKNRKKSETDRYIAMMGAAKLGGAGIVREICAFLQDDSWMLRSGALRLLAVLGGGGKVGEVGTEVLNSLKDPALVVRTEAVETVRALKIPGAADALFKTLQDPANYHRGKALWVPQKILYALVDLGAVEMAPKLSQFIRSAQRPKDPQFIQLAEKTIETLNRQTSDSTASSSRSVLHQ